MAVSPCTSPTRGFPRARSAPDGGDGLVESWNQVVAPRYAQLRMQRPHSACRVQQQKTDRKQTEVRAGGKQTYTVDEAKIGTQVIRQDKQVAHRWELREM